MQYYEVGRIINTHGIHGEVKVMVITDFPEERFAKGVKLSVKLADGQRQELTVENARPQKQFLLVKFQGLDNINDVLAFHNCTLEVASDQLKPLPAGQYYYHQIIGLAVETVDGQPLGKIKEIMPTGANDVWVVARPKQKDLLLPNIPDVVKKVDLAAGKVTVELMEGLE